MTNVFVEIFGKRCRRLQLSEAFVTYC